MSEAGSIYRNFAKQFPEPSDGDLRIYWIPQVPEKAMYWPVRDLREADTIITMLSAYDDFQFGERVKGDYSNMGGVHIFRNGEWEEWESDDADDFDTYADKRWPLAHRYLRSTLHPSEEQAQAGSK